MKSSFKQINIQKVFEKVLFGWIFLIIAGHFLLATFQYVIPYWNYGSYLRWASLIFLIVTVLYAILSLVYSSSSRTGIIDTLKKYFTFEQVILFIVFLWFGLSVYLNGRREKILEFFFKVHDWYLFDTFLCMLVIFPLPRLIGKEKTKRIVELLIHIVVITYSIFTIYCLWHIFHLKVLELPSGEQACMMDNMQLMLGFNPNNTGMIAVTMFCLCIYIIFTQNNCLIRILYIFFAFAQLITTYLTNSRTPFLAVVVFLSLLSFFLCFCFLKNRAAFFQIIMSLAVSVLSFLLFWRFRSWVFLTFEKITRLQESVAADLAVTSKKFTPGYLSFSKNTTMAVNIAASYGRKEIRLFNSLSGREKIWNICIKIMTENPFQFFFGITPAEVSDRITTLGDYLDRIGHAHNAIIQIGVSVGVPIMIAYFIFLTQVAEKCLRVFLKLKNENCYTIVISAIIICFFLINLTEPYLFAYFSILSCFFYLFSGCIVEITNESALISPKSTRARLIMIRTMLIYIICIMAIILYAHRFINLDHEKISGSGTKDDPFLIENKTDLFYFRDLVNHGNSFKQCYFLQTDDIDLCGVEWEPIGLWNLDYYFSGIYDGGCHVIENLVIHDSLLNGRTNGRAGLFGYLNGMVKNLGIESGIIEGHCCGSIASITQRKSIILNCYNKAEVICSGRAGGICDYFSKGMVINCLNEGQLIAPDIANLVSYNANIIYGQDQAHNTAFGFTGTFVPIEMSGDTIQEKLNDGQEKLIERGILRRPDVRFWS